MASHPMPQNTLRPFPILSVPSRTNNVPTTAVEIMPASRHVVLPTLVEVCIPNPLAHLLFLR